MTHAANKPFNFRYWSPGGFLNHFEHNGNYVIE